MEQLQSHIWLTSSSYMGKYLRISSFSRKPFLIYDFATAPLWISLYMRKIGFSFLSVQYKKSLVGVNHSVMGINALTWLLPHFGQANGKWGQHEILITNTFDLTAWGRNWKADSHWSPSRPITGAHIGRILKSFLYLYFFTSKSAFCLNFGRKYVKIKNSTPNAGGIESFQIFICSCYCALQFTSGNLAYHDDCTNKK